MLPLLQVRRVLAEMDSRRASQVLQLRALVAVEVNLAVLLLLVVLVAVVQAKQQAQQTRAAVAAAVEKTLQRLAQLAVRV